MGNVRVCIRVCDGVRGGGAFMFCVPQPKRTTFKYTLDNEKNAHAKIVQGRETQTRKTEITYSKSGDNVVTDIACFVCFLFELEFVSCGPWGRGGV